jgi:peptide/nickel transport system substrate-binding protein
MIRLNVVNKISAVSLVLLTFLLSACQDATPSPSSPLTEIPATARPTNQPSTQAPTEATFLPVENTPMVQVITPTPEPSGPRALVYCTPEEPASLYFYGPDWNLYSLSLILQAIYDGPIDNRGFDYQPVILEKLPSLGDGDAQLKPVEVSAGDRVVDAEGNPVALEPGVRVRPSGCHADGCAVEYGGSPGFQMDQLSATFRLLPGLLWSDGQPLTAADSVYAFNLAADPDTTADKTVIDLTASYASQDDRTVEWVGLPGYLDATYFTNFWSPFPEHLWHDLSPADLLEADLSNQKPLGWGPYEIEEWNHGESITMVKNPNYFRASEGLPRFDRLVFRFVADDTSASLSSLLSGECDVLDRNLLSTDVQSGGADQLLALSNSDQIHLEITSGSRWEHLDFGIQPVSYDDGWQSGDRPDFFSDVRVRRAFALCMDRSQMGELSNLGQSFVADSYLSPQHPLYNPDVAHYDYDPATGSALLEQAGWIVGETGVRVYAGENAHIPPGTRLSMTNDALADINREAEQRMVESLAECGIEVSVNYWASEIFAIGPEGFLFGRKFDLAQFRWLTGASPPCDLYLTEQVAGSPDGQWISVMHPGDGPLGFPLGWGGNNNPGFSDPEYDQACRSALQSLPGQPGYAENHLRAQQIFTEQLPVIPLFINTNIAVARPDFCGQILDPSENIETWNIEAWGYGQGCQ